MFSALIDYRSQWRAILDECEYENVSQLRLRALAFTAPPEMLPFLLEERARLEHEWDAIRDTDAGDLSDEYWRKVTCISDLMGYLGRPAAEFLIDRLDSTQASHRAVAATLLGAVLKHVNRGRLQNLLARETDPAVQAALTKLLEPQP